jgi:hypothetical protein
MTPSGESLEQEPPLTPRAILRVRVQIDT